MEEEIFFDTRADRTLNNINNGDETERLKINWTMSEKKSKQQ